MEEKDLKNSRRIDCSYFKSYSCAAWETMREQLHLSSYKLSCQREIFVPTTISQYRLIYIFERDRRRDNPSALRYAVIPSSSPN